MNCYEFSEYIYGKGTLDGVVDATYLLTMRNSDRKEQYMAQLKKYRPSKHVNIVTNQGHTRCKKELCDDNACKPVDNTNKDITHATMAIYKHALGKKYDRILILEDDCTFSDEFLNKEHAKNIGNRLQVLNNSKYIYRLGGIPFVSLFNGWYHRYGVVTMAAHAYIINARTMQYVSQKQSNIVDIDIQFTMDLSIHNYHYYMPLAYQLFEVTDNQKNWGNTHNIVLTSIMKLLIWPIMFLFKALELDKHPEPGTSRLYMANRILYDYTLPILLLFLVYRFFIERT